ncbi:hypothetical protein PILCRDRAFT_826459 [Piloderma croceum F 1598]|uniref:NACHT domain-containing protein n=1 Tax=Piloderma croceum (strain F 1598) TaxID=765440 RepID=A0A0C3F8Q6_PILCF|nr:hypothetical protein PILCRDRAFT_826459 [Piloderma croceum F 1598]
MDASGRTECLPNTRTEMIHSISNWAKDLTGAYNVLWLRGLAGSGKSTLSTTVANKFRECGWLGAFIFFDRDASERSDPATVIRTLAYQVGLLHTRAGEAISGVIDKFPDICSSPVRAQFQRLLVDPLSDEGVIDPNTPLVLILDALDECGSSKKRESLLELLAEQSVRLPSAIRILITSRAERDIRGAFVNRGHVLIQELDITSHANANDISCYIRDRMIRMQRNSPDLLFGTDWPREDDIRRLTDRAYGLFVWASTAVEFMDGHDPRRRMNIIFHGDITSGAEYALDALYRTALASAGNWDDDDFIVDFKAVVGMILVARHPLSSTAIDLLLHLPGDRPCSHTISQLGCLFQQKPTVRFLHPSFADFLSTQSRCVQEPWYFSQALHNRALAMRCLHRLDQVLRRNICDLTLSADIADLDLPEDVSYSCIFWIDHICAIEDDPTSVVEKLCSFLYRHLLHWLEAMSILKRSRQTVALLDRLLTWISNHAPNEASLSNLVRDACRFARVFASSIEEHALLVYLTALPLMPVETALYKAFHDARSYPSVAGALQQYSSPLLLLITGHAAEVHSVAISPDGTRIASGSSDRTIRVWDATSGAEVLPPLQGHRDRVLSVAFSPVGNCIASGSADKTIRVWDAISGTEVLRPLRGHDDWIVSVAFSLGGDRIVSASEDKTVRVWNGITGMEIVPALRGHAHHVQAVAFSPDGSRIVSGSLDQTVRVWNSASGLEVLPALRGHTDTVWSVAFSPDGSRIVSGSQDQTIRVWDSKLGAELLALRGHRSMVRSVTFSPDGNRIVSGSYDNTIPVWDIISGAEILPPFQGHDWVLSVAFSPNESHIISGSFRKEIRVWDATASANIAPSRQNHEGLVLSVCFSSDRTRIVSGSIDKTIRVWDATSGMAVLPALRGHHDGVISVAFSSDMSLIVSGSYDKTIRVWNASSGAEVLPALQGHEGIVWSVVFSPDSNLIASGSSDKSIRVWDGTSGVEVRTLRGHEGIVWSVAFSPDSKRIVSGSGDHTIRVWDMASSCQLFPALQVNAATSVAFSLDGIHIVSGTSSKMTDHQ